MAPGWHLPVATLCRNYPKSPHPKLVIPAKPRMIFVASCPSRVARGVEPDPYAVGLLDDFVWQRVPALRRASCFCGDNICPARLGRDDKGTLCALHAIFSQRTLRVPLRPLR